VYSGLHAFKAGVKDALSPQPLFGDLGLKYVGPVDGHDLVAMEAALRGPRDFGGTPWCTRGPGKVCGYPPAENDEIEQMHKPGHVRPGHRAPRSARRRAAGRRCSPRRWWRSARSGRTLVAITAAMLLPPRWVSPRSRRPYPERCFDVGSPSSTR